VLLIPCPWCGPRGQDEFGYGGQAGVPYPARPSTLDDQRWAAYLFVRANPKGPLHERWYHAAGCRRWFTVVRDTATNAIRAPERPDPAGPAAAR